ncbi:MAG: FAD-binding oxidoreductase, partial [Thermoplasmata archaeon]|nr:FAD-binding oxidoreductase [Thermoplasmata archaeon]
MTGYDAIIIGGGSVGTPTAFFLAQQGYEVLVLDKNASVGQGQNKAAIGGVRATHADPAKIALCRKSLEIFSTWEERYGRDIGWKKGGYCFPVYREEEERTLKGILPIQKEHGLNIDWLDKDGIIEAVPGINPNGLAGGTLSPDDGQVSPLLFIEAMEKEARALGCTFEFNTHVKGLVMEKGRVTGVDTNKGTRTADVVVNAAGAYAKELNAKAGIDTPIQPDSHEAGISAPVKPFLGPLMVDLRPGLLDKTANFYFGQTHTGAIIFCYTPMHAYIGTDRRSTSEFMPVIARRLVNLIPRLKNLLIRRVWRGLYPMTPDGIGIVGSHPSTEGFYMGVGMCGQGFML